MKYGRNVTEWWLITASKYRTFKKTINNNKKMPHRTFVDNRSYRPDGDSSFPWRSPRNLELENAADVRHSDDYWNVPIRSHYWLGGQMVTDTERALEILGFTDITLKDYLFYTAVPPECWTKRTEGRHGEHINPEGTIRVSTFFKPLIYDRKAEATFLDDQFQRPEPGRRK